MPQPLKSAKEISKQLLDQLKCQSSHSTATSYTWGDLSSVAEGGNTNDSYRLEKLTLIFQLLIMSIGTACFAVGASVR